MPITSSSDDVLCLTAAEGLEEVELDTKHPQSDEDLVRDLHARFRPMPADRLVDADVTGDDAAGV